MITPSFADIPQPDKDQIKHYVQNYTKQKKRALLVHGPPGSCKTSAIHALADELGLELVEINASDYRTADEINTRLGNAVYQQSLFGTGKLIFIDEVDGISGQKDRGGVKAITDIMKQSTFPIIIAANDVYSDKLKTLRTKCQLLEFPPIATSATTQIIQNTLEPEGLQLNQQLIKAISRRSGGDLRGALIDAELLARTQETTLEAVHGLSDRARTETIQQALLKILKTTDSTIARGALDSVDEHMDEVFLWLEENLPKEYQGKDLARGMDTLSRADQFRGRIRRWQYWRYLAYVNTLLTAGIAVAKDNKPGGKIEYTRNKRLLKIWMANQKYAKRKNIANKIAAYCHCSTRKALHTLPHLKPIILHHPEIAEELQIDEEELSWLRK